MYSDRFTGADTSAGFSSGCGMSPVDCSTIHFASWFGSRGRLPFAMVMIYREKWINWVTVLDWEKRNVQTTPAITTTITQMCLFFTKT